ncbi:MAG TPA: rhodanese-like domain-containing protein [Acidimicrobiia bacterium]|nr:rhodanese-like domain-containing protein [Acidimicrobiia bacterium]
MSPIEQVPAPEWRTWLSVNQGMILDVREPHEWAMGTLPDAVRISMGDIPDRVEDLVDEKAVLVVCRSGVRSEQVAVFLLMNGLVSVANLAGGMKALGMQD